MKEEHAAELKMWNASRFCVSSLRRGHANLLCIVPILVYVLPKQVQIAWQKDPSSQYATVCNEYCPISAVDSALDF